MFLDLRKNGQWLEIIMIAMLAFTSQGLAQGPTLELTQVATGLSSPTFITHAPGDATRLFITERAGNIKILNLSSGTVTIFMTSAQLSSANGLTSGNERGLLGLAFDPNYATNRRFYVNYTGTNGHTFVRSFVTQAANPNLVDGNNGAANILNFNQDFSNHNGGWIAFGPDNQLYIATGDGGSGNDPNNRALDRSSLLGKMLRISPNTTSTGGYTPSVGNPFLGDGNTNTRDEIWAYGLRNPWRNSFDRLTGDLYIADVGQNAREEINFQYANSTGGQNYGWRQWEGTASTGLSGSSNQGSTTDTKPVYDYLQSSANGRSITGGYVYRGPLTALQGQYFYGDYVGRTLLSFEFDRSMPGNFNGNNVRYLTNWTLIARNPLGVSVRGSWSTFGEDAIGNLYAADLNTGNIFRFNKATLPADLTSVELVTGSVVAGTVNDLRTSNNQYLRTLGQTRLRQPKVPANLELKVWAISPVINPAIIDVAIESRINQKRGNAVITAMNWDTNEHETIGKFEIGTTESINRIRVVDAAKFVNASGELEFRIMHISSDSSQPLESFFDHIQIDLGG